MGHPVEQHILHFVQDDNPKIPTPPTEGGMGHPDEQQILHFVQDDNPKIPTPPTDGGMGHPRLHVAFVETPVYRIYGWNVLSAGRAISSARITWRRAAGQSRYPEKSPPAPR